jgi:hypothetical protein
MGLKMHYMKRIVLVASTVISFVSTAGAMPLAPLDQSQTGFVVRVEGGCGPGFHRDRFAGCRPNRPVVVAPAPPVVVAPVAPGPAAVAPAPPVVVVAPAGPVVVAPAAPVVVAPCRRVCDAFRCWRTCR